MKWIKYLILVVGFASLSHTQKATAQIDTTFWFAPPWVTPDHDGNVQMALRISTFGAPAAVRVELPTAGYDTTINVAANSLYSQSMTHKVLDLESAPADVVLNSGMKISSDELITVVYDFISDTVNISPGNANNPETYSLKGQNGMGLEFVVPFQTLWDNRALGVDRNGDGIVTQPKQYFSIVATEDNTTIYIKPKADVVGGHPADVTYSVFLPLAGNVYTCENTTLSTSDPGETLSGSIIVADKPVAVTINDDSVNPSGGGGCFDLMGDQIVPTDVIGNEYNINEGDLNAGSNESVFIVATENFTSLTMDDGVATTALINQGDTYQYSIDQPLTSVIADKPVYVVHMSGYGCELGLAIIPPSNCAGSDQVSFSRNNDDAFFLNLLCPAGSEGDFTLTGIGAPPILPGSFAPVPGTGGSWMGAQIQFTTGEIVPGSAYLLENASEFFSMGVFNGSPTGGCLYHYMSSFVRKVNIDAGEDTTICSGDVTINLNGQISGGTTTGVWSVVSGTGTFGSPTTNLINTYDPSPSDIASGELIFALESTGNCLPEYDTMRVTFIESPVVDAGIDQVFCINNVPEIPLDGTLTFAVGSEWSGGTGGAFGDISDLNTTYTPSPADLGEDSIIIYIESTGSLFSCPDDRDSLVIYFTEPPVVNAGPDIVTCASQDSVELDAGTVTGASSTGIWTTSGSGVFSPSETDIINHYLISAADTTAGSVTLVLTSTLNGGCLAVSDSLSLTILDRPQIIITTEDSVCANATTIDLDGFVTPGYSTEWSVDGFGTIDDDMAIPTVYNLDPADTIGGTLWIYLEANGGLCPVEQDSLELTFIAPPTAFAGLDQAFCVNEPIPLNGLIGGSASGGTWGSTGTGTFTPSPALLNTFYIPSALDISNGFVELFLTSDADFGCVADQDTITVTYLDPPEADFTFTTACVGENIFFTDESTTPSGTIVSWQYDFGDGTTSIANDPIKPFPGSGSYYTELVVQNSLGCFDTTGYTIWVNPNPVPAISHDYACQGVEVQFSSTSFISSGEIVDYAWDFNSGEGSSTNQNPGFTFETPGTYPVLLTVTSDSGCTASITVDVEVLTGPTADFAVNPSPALALEDVFFTDLSTGGPFIDWLWDFGDGSGGNAQNEIHQYAVGGLYDISLEVTDTAGCIASVTKPIEVVLLPVVPTAFTPNNDGENDVFLIRGGPFEAVDFQVYNNWGQLIFTSNDQSIGWDGTFNGEESPIGVYTWTFTVSLAGDRVVVKEGDVTLIR